MNMNKKHMSPRKSDRRNFLKGVAVVGGATALSSVSAGIVSKSEPEPKPGKAKTRASKGYHETPHIQAYYETLRGT